MSQFGRFTRAAVLSAGWLGLSTTLGSAFETNTLFSSKAWLVRHEYYPDTGSQACSARTHSRASDTLDITIWEDAGHTLFIFLGNAPWDGSFTDDLKLHVDYDRWTLNHAEFSDNGTVKFSFADVQNLFKFLEDVMAGQVLALKTPNERDNIAVFSLSGSRAAITNLFGCYQKIMVRDGNRYGGGNTYGSRYGD